MLDPTLNCGSPVVDYRVDYLGYHFGESMVMAARNPGPAIVAKAEYFDSNFQQRVRVVPEHVEHCSLFAKHMLEKDQCPPESRLVPVPGHCRL